MTRDSDEARIQALFEQIEKSFGSHVQAIMVFRDTKKRLMWVASPYDAEFTGAMLDYARANFSETPVEHIYERYERKSPEDS